MARINITGIYIMLNVCHRKHGIRINFTIILYTPVTMMTLMVTVTSTTITTVITKMLLR